MGVSSTLLKYSEIKLLFKNGDKTNMMNYRPISSLTSFSKVTEKVILVRLFCHIKSNNILPNQQFGFRINSSIEVTSFNLINKILQSLNNKIPAGGIFCDLNKAFDCVNHVLLSKLKFYGIVGKVNQCIGGILPS
jgi:hypothetical protein